MTKPRWKSRADDLDYVDFAEQERQYRAETGDKPWFIGFDSRFSKWCEENPCRDLIPGTLSKPGCV